jgi:hypothetical protein
MLAAQDITCHMETVGYNVLNHVVKSVYLMCASIYRQLKPKPIGRPEFSFTRHHGKIQVDNIFLYRKAT